MDDERSPWDGVIEITQEFSKYFPLNLAGEELDVDGEKYLVTNATLDLATWIYEIDMRNFDTGEKTRYTGNKEGVIKEEILEPALI